MVSFTLLWRFHPANQLPQEVEPCHDKSGFRFAFSISIAIFLFVSCNGTNEAPKPMPPKVASTIELKASQIEPKVIQKPSRPATSESVDHASAEYNIDGYRLVLYTESNRCHIGYRRDRVGTIFNKLTLSLNPPCNWLLRTDHADERLKKPLAGRMLIGEQGGPLAWKYLDNTNTTVALVIGGEPFADEILDRANPGRLTQLKKSKCGSQIQAVLLAPEVVRLSSNVDRNGSYCANDGSDEKLFWIFAHEQH
jgi:hypothetical protein